MRLINLVGKRFGHWVVLEQDPERVGNPRGAYWWCRCDCGECDQVVKSIAGVDLRRGESQSCGSLARQSIVERSTRHGYANTPTYSSWASMVQRCTNTKNPAYDKYGGAGVVIEDVRWLDFVNFLADMGERPEGTTLDRKDNERGYCLGNCRWATPKAQAANRRARGVVSEQTISRLADDFRLSPLTIASIVASLGLEIVFDTKVGDV